eukprot:scaffold2589_cov273-Chaetoceros_neogracile.AAC.15
MHGGKTNLSKLPIQKQVGAPGSNNGRGSAFLFSRANETFDHAESEITGFDDGDRLGWSVSLALTGKRFIIGVPGRGKSNSVQFGSTLIYQIGKNSSLEMSKEIYGEGESNEESDFGFSVAMNQNGTMVAISSPSIGVIRRVTSTLLDLELSVQVSFKGDNADRVDDRSGLGSNISNSKVKSTLDEA